MCLEAHCVLGFIFSLTGIFKRHNFQRMINNLYPININCTKLVSMCSLGTDLWLMLVLVGHLCSLNRVTVEIDICATYHIFALPSFAGQNSIATSISASSLLLTSQN